MSDRRPENPKLDDGYSDVLTALHRSQGRAETAMEKSRRELHEMWAKCDDVTEQDMIDAMPLIPNEIREKLAEGPHPRRWTCGVCVAFPAAWYKNETPDRTDPRWRVFAYHELPKLDMTYANEQWYGELANETYRRCIATYRAAGWTGEAEEPNA